MKEQKTKAAHRVGIRDFVDRPRRMTQLNDKSERAFGAINLLSASIQGEEKLAVIFPYPRGGCTLEVADVMVSPSVVAWICSLRELLLAKEPTREIDIGLLNNPNPKANLMSRRGGLTNP